MKNYSFLLLALALLINSEISSQPIKLSFQLIDNDSKIPISNAHVFLANTTFGSVSDNNGDVLFMVPDGLTENLLISHVAYEVKILDHLQYELMTEGKAIFLSSNNLRISELVISAKRSNKWKKQLKKFKKAFLGDDKIADKCKILNPEVLRFEEKGGEFSVSAIDIILISNPYLGYEVKYFLSHLTIQDNGSIEYLGQAQFIDKIENYRTLEIEENREKTFKSSPKYFFQSLIKDELSEAGYEVSIVKYNDGVFTTLAVPSREEILIKAINGNGYQLQFSEFLQIVNKNEKSVNFNTVGVRPGGLESQKFGTGVRTEKANIEYATSHLYKIAPSLNLNGFGNVLNTRVVKEYGSWADQKMALQLPFDYGNDYDLGKANIRDNGVEPKLNNDQDVLTSEDKYTLLLSLLYKNDDEIKRKTMQIIVENWQEGFIGPFIEILRFSNDKWLINKINSQLRQKYNVSESYDFNGWLKWMWSREIPNEDYYFRFKSELYRNVDPKFETYFKGRQKAANIRLDEVVWGGVLQDGIPPLRYPKMINSGEADYMESDDIIFGVYINGEARAYPQRILAWHEFFVDTFGDLKLAGVYCTLCGTVIMYDMTYKGNFHNLGTSGFLYRSNKLMYDKTTQSLWSTIGGIPVIGPLVDQGIELETYPVVTSTWKTWIQLHPESKVLSIRTGHNRDYRKGAAYSEYFSTDELMFPVISLDKRLNNKDEVLVVRAQGYKDDPLAISINYIKKKGWYQGRIGDISIVVVADKSGAARAYDAEEIMFKSFKNNKLQDEGGKFWAINEECISSDDGNKLDRLPAHNIFWFAWYNAYPDTRLVK